MTYPAITPDPLALGLRTNRRLNDVLLAHLTPGMLEAVTPGGFTVAQHLAHMAFVTSPPRDAVNA